jgi:SsrA-binding protein
MKSAAGDSKKPFRHLVATNRKARHEYVIEDTLEAGIELRGSEVKTLRSHRVSFADSYARVLDDQCWLIGLQLDLYEKAHVQLPDPLRKRRLLLNRREIDRLRAKTQRGGRTIVPLEIYFKGSWAKVLLGVGRGKTFGDKRAALRETEVRRDIDRTLKAARRSR